MIIVLVILNVISDNFSRKTNDNMLNYLVYNILTKGIIATFRSDYEYETESEFNF